mmetsp:Transcript_42219/g.101600  ORF Transcript_42219/g.101600 Transcript_42219/m.101600 type:complete len:527 (+) Transcript_42219:83-1663(+)
MPRARRRNKMEAAKDVGNFNAGTSFDVRGGGETTTTTTTGVIGNAAAVAVVSPQPQKIKQEQEAVVDTGDDDDDRKSGSSPSPSSPSSARNLFGTTAAAEGGDGDKNNTNEYGPEDDIVDYGHGNSRCSEDDDDGDDDDDDDDGDGDEEFQLDEEEKDDLPMKKRPSKRRLSNSDDSKDSKKKSASAKQHSDGSRSGSNSSSSNSNSEAPHQPWSLELQQYFEKKKKEGMECTALRLLAIMAEDPTEFYSKKELATTFQESYGKSLVLYEKIRFDDSSATEVKHNIETFGSWSCAKTLVRHNLIEKRRGGTEWYGRITTTGNEFRIRLMTYFRRRQVSISIAQASSSSSTISLSDRPKLNGKGKATAITGMKPMTSYFKPLIKPSSGGKTTKPTPGPTPAPTPAPTPGPTYSSHGQSVHSSRKSFKKPTATTATKSSSKSTQHENRIHDDNDDKMMSAVQANSSTDSNTRGINGPRQAIFYFLLGIFFIINTTVLGWQQHVLTIFLPLIVICICHYVALRIFLRRP